KEKDLQVWRWTWFCSGESGCQRLCGGIGSCIETCNHYTNYNLKNPLDMHKCSIRITTEVMLSEVDTDLSMHMIISANKNTTKEVKMKLLAPHNSVSPNKLQKLHNNQRSICDDVKLRQLLERDDLRCRRSRSKEEAIELGHAYELFIRTLPLPEITKECVKPMTTNNFTKRMNKSIEGRRENSSQFIFEASQVTYWNARIIEHQALSFKQPADVKRRLNQGRLCVLLYLVKPVVGENDLYFYVKKGNNKFCSPYTMKYINLDNESYQLLQPLLNKLISKHL
ncbi:12741_t:CDS:2, partial [Racocetra persica]